MFSNAVPNIYKKPVTVPTIPNARQDSAMNHPTLILSSVTEVFSKVNVFLPIQIEVNMKIIMIRKLTISLAILV